MLLDNLLLQDFRFGAFRVLAPSGAFGLCGTLACEIEFGRLGG